MSRWCLQVVVVSTMWPNLDRCGWKLYRWDIILPDTLDVHHTLRGILITTEFWGIQRDPSDSWRFLVNMFGRIFSQNVFLLLWWWEDFKNILKWEEQCKSDNEQLRSAGVTSGWSVITRLQLLERIWICYLILYLLLLHRDLMIDPRTSAAHFAQKPKMSVPMDSSVRPWRLDHNEVLTQVWDAAGYRCCTWNNGSMNENKDFKHVFCFNWVTTKSLSHHRKSADHKTTHVILRLEITPPPRPAVNIYSHYTKNKCTCSLKREKRCKRW